MKRGFVLVTGGCRSGKSAWALETALRTAAPSKVYIATCPLLDDELRARAARHQQERAGQGWTTVEEETNVVGAVRAAPDDAVLLLDCVTLWINNIIWHAHGSADEALAAREAAALADALADRSGPAVLVTNETGMGIVPADADARLFRDMTGRANQILAARADEVWFMVSGIPVRIR